MPEELTVQQVASRFGTSNHVVYYWIEHGVIRSRRVGPGMPVRRQLEHRADDN
jgi:excisionase family DNA binding protein